MEHSYYDRKKGDCLKVTKQPYFSYVEQLRSVSSEVTGEHILTISFLIIKTLQKV